MQDIDWQRVVSLTVDHTKHPRGLVEVRITLRRRGGEGLRDAVVAGPMRVEDAIWQAYEIADGGFREANEGE